MFACTFKARQVWYVGGRDCQETKCPGGPSTQYLRTLVPKTTKSMVFGMVPKTSKSMVFGTRDLEYRVLGPSGNGSGSGCARTFPWGPEALAQPKVGRLRTQNPRLKIPYSSNLQQRA